MQAHIDIHELSLRYMRNDKLVKQKDLGKNRKNVKMAVEIMILYQPNIMAIQRNNMPHKIESNHHPLVYVIKWLVALIIVN